MSYLNLSIHPKELQADEKLEAQLDALEKDIKEQKQRESRENSTKQTLTERTKNTIFLNRVSLAKNSFSLFTLKR